MLLETAQLPAQLPAQDRRPEILEADVATHPSSKPSTPSTPSKPSKPEATINGVLVSDVWETYIACRSVHVRDALLVHYQPLVKKVAYSVVQKLPNHFEVDDLFSYGQFGLVEAIDRFELDRGVKFEAYASVRVRGAMLDHIRQQEWMPRRVWARLREMKVAHDDLVRELGREPSSLQVADRMGITVEALLTAQAKSAANKSSVSLDAVSESGVSLDVADAGSTDFALSVEMSRACAALAGAAQCLPPVHKAIVFFYYVQGMKMRDIARVLGLRESLACALHARAALMLRERLALTC